MIRFTVEFDPTTEDWDISLEQGQEELGPLGWSYILSTILRDHHAPKEPTAKVVTPAAV